MVEIATYDDVGDVEAGLAQLLPHQCPFIWGADNLYVNHYQVPIIYKLEGYELGSALK